MTEFVCAYFGKGSNGKEWTINARGFATAKEAEKHGLFMMPTAGVHGFAVIKESKDFWEVMWFDSILPPGVSVGTSDFQNYDITMAKQIEYVR